jgi:hypothetical protein
MAPRLQLQSLLSEITENVYFQPPNNVQMQYPCIVYAREGSYAAFANNEKFILDKKYQIMVIDRDPDSILPDKVEELAYCQFNRFFPADNLNHWVFTLFF